MCTPRLQLKDYLIEAGVVPLESGICMGEWTTPRRLATTAHEEYMGPSGDARGFTAPGEDDWASLQPGALRSRAEQACLRLDVAALWSLTRVYLALQSGEAGPRSAHTLRAYRQSVELLVQHWSGDTLRHPDPEAAAALVAELAASGLSSASLKVRLAGARAFYRALMWAGVAESDPFAGIRLVASKSPARATHPYTDAEREALLAAADPVDRALILLIAEAGLRPSEVTALRGEDVDLASGRLTLRRGRRGEERLVSLSNTVVRALSLLPLAPDEPVLGYTSEARARQRMLSLSERAGVPYRGVDPLRPRRGASARRARAPAIEGIPDIRPLREELARALALAKRTGTACGLIHLDLQYGPEVNDKHTAERIVGVVIERLRHTARGYDVITWTGPARLSVILPNLPSHEVLGGIAARFQAVIVSHPVGLGAGITIPVAVSMAAVAGADDADDLLREAEQSLSHATPGSG